MASLSLEPISTAADFKLSLAANYLFTANLMELLNRYSITEITVADLYNYLALPALAIAPYVDDAITSIPNDELFDRNFTPLKIVKDNKLDIYNFLSYFVNTCMPSGKTVYFLGDSLNFIKQAYDMYLFRLSADPALSKTIPFSGNMFSDASESLLMTNATSLDTLAAAYAGLLENNAPFREMRTKLASGERVVLADYLNYGKGVKTLIYLLYVDPAVREKVANLELVLWFAGSLEPDQTHNQASIIMAENLLDFVASEKPKITFMIMNTVDASKFTNSERYLQRCTPKYGYTKWGASPDPIYAQRNATLYLQCNITKYLLFLQTYGMIEHLMTLGDIPVVKFATPLENIAVSINDIPEDLVKAHVSKTVVCALLGHIEPALKRFSETSRQVKMTITIEGLIMNTARVRGFDISDCV